MKVKNPLSRVGLEDLSPAKPVQAGRIARIANAAILYRSNQAQEAFILQRKQKITQDPTAYVDLICKKIRNLKESYHSESPYDIFNHAINLAVKAGADIQYQPNYQAHQYALALALIDKFAQQFGLSAIFGLFEHDIDQFIARIGEATGYASGSHEIIRAQIGAAIEKLMKKSGKELLEEKRKELIDERMKNHLDFKIQYLAFAARKTKGMSVAERSNYIWEEHFLLETITAKLINYKKVLKSVGIEPGSVYRGRTETTISESAIQLQIHTAKKSRRRYLPQAIKPSPFKHEPSFFETHSDRNRWESSNIEEYERDTEQVFDLRGEDTGIDADPLPPEELRKNANLAALTLRFEELIKPPIPQQPRPIRPREGVSLPKLLPFADDDEELPVAQQPFPESPVSLPDLGTDSDDEAIGVFPKGDSA